MSENARIEALRLAVETAIRLFDRTEVDKPAQARAWPREEIAGLVEHYHRHYLRLLTPADDG